MKKILALLVVTLTMSLTAKAQEQKPATTKEVTTASKAESAEAQNDFMALDKAVKLTERQRGSFKGLFGYKYKMLEKKANDTAGKEELSKSIEAKIRATLTPEQMAVLDKDPELLKKLIK